MLAVLDRCGLAQRDQRQAVALGKLGVDAVVVVALVEGGGIGQRTPSPGRVDQRSDGEGFVLAAGGYPPGDREVGRSADRRVEPVAVEPAALRVETAERCPQEASVSE